MNNMYAQQAKEQAIKNKSRESRSKEGYEECQKRIKRAVFMGETSTTCERCGPSDEIESWIFKTIHDKTLQPEVRQKLEDDGFKLSSETLTRREYWDDEDYQGWYSKVKLTNVFWN
jgi:hypothetical protein